MPTTEVELQGCRKFQRMQLKLIVYYMYIYKLDLKSINLSEGLSRDRGATGSSLTGVTALCP